jgi:outer membrane receptor protein involved in Fe transport
LVLSMLFAVFAFAQTETGQISGTISDPSGAVVPNTEVTVTNVGTGATRSATSSNSGQYVFTNLQPGAYEVTINAQGFQPFKRKVDVTVGSRNTVDTSLALAGGATTVEVVAEGGATVDTTDQTLGQTVNNVQITQLPTLTRDPYDLVSIAGNVQEDQSQRGAGFAINGQRSASTNILLDGGENVDQFDATVGQNVPLDSVQEFKVLTSNFTAEYGRATGGVVNVATRSGTNDFHGTAYEFNRISEFSSNTAENNASGIPKSRFVRNQFGYSVGGPIIKNKLFFFNSTEWTRVRSSLTDQAWVPSPEFLALSAPATQEFFNTFGALKSGAAVSDVLTKADVPARGATFDSLPAATPLFNLINYPVVGDAGGGPPQNAYSLVARADYNFSDRTTLYGRYALESQDQFAGVNASSPYAGYDTAITNFNNNILLNLTRVWGPSVVTQSKFTFNRLNNLQPLGDAPAGPTLYPQPTSAFRFTGLRVAFPGYLPFNPGSAIPFGGPQNLYQAFQDISWNKGSHQFRFGGQYIHTRDNRTFGAFQNAVEAVGRQGGFLVGDSTNPLNPARPSGMENFLTGNLFQFQGAVDPQGAFPCLTDPATGLPIATPTCTVALPAGQPRFSRNNRFNDFAAYIQDAWKVTPRFTLNLGVRYEYYGVQHNVDPNLDSNFYYGPGANLFERIRTGQVLTTPNAPVSGLWGADWNNFAPRVGFAFDVFGNGKTSFRGGYGIAYERNFGNVTFNVIQNPPNYAVVSIVTGTDVASQPITTSNAGPLGLAGPPVPLPRTSVRQINQDIRTSYAHMYSMAFEQELMPNTIFGLEYSGSRGIRQYSLEDPNRPGSGVIYGGDDPNNPLDPNAAFTRLNTQYSNLNTRNDQGDSYYNGLNLSLRSTNLYKTGLNLNVNYTWSHAIDTLSSTFSDLSTNFNLGLLDPFNPGLDRGDADFDVRHRVAFSMVYEVPFFNNLNGWSRQLLGGWSLAPIFSARTGYPFTLFDCTNGNVACSRAIFNDPAAINRGSREAGSVQGPNAFTYFAFPVSDTTGYANPLIGVSDFGNCTVPGQGALGPCPYPATMERRNAFRAPGTWNLDLGVYKRFKITERFGLQLRAEAYNLFNHSNLYIDPNSIDVTNVIGTDASGGDVFGVIAKQGIKGAQAGLGAEADERRNLQLGIKIEF